MPKPQKSAKARGNEERVPSGIPGLDNLMEGGFIQNDIYLVTGGTGTGKTLFCCQFLWEGLQRGENGIFFSLEEIPEDVLSDAMDFGWDFQKYIDQKKFIMQYYDPFEMVDITTEVKEMIKKFNAKRIVIDSTSIFGMFLQNEQEIRKAIYNLIKALKGIDAVVLMTAEVLEGSKRLSRYGVEEFVVDGVILLNYLGVGELSSRSLLIRKMRRTNHGKESYILDITKSGMKISKEKGI